MNHKICNLVRSEIEHKDLLTPISDNSNEHLRNCVECQEFQNKEMNLRQIVGSLETVKAPPDFDFRLRARLANEHQRGNNWFSSMYVWRLRSLAVAAMLLIFAATVVMIRQTEIPSQPPTVADGGPASPGIDPADKPAPGDNNRVAVQDQASLDSGVNAGSSTQTADNLGRRQIPQRPSPKRPSTSIDFSSVGATVVRHDDAARAAFPLEVPQQSFTVSLDDARGMSRTISVPTVSFGSRRVLTSGTVSTNQFAPKGDW